MNKKTKKTLLASCACIMAVAIGIGGTLAYLTDNETHTNTFSLGGNVTIDLTEPGWPTEDTDDDGIPDEAEDLTPNGEVTKDPQVTNESDNDVVVFLRVTVPVKDVTKVADNGEIQTVTYTQSGDTDAAWNGTGIAHSSQEIFYFKQSSDAITSHANNFNSNWINLTGEEDVYVDGTNYTSSWLYGTGGSKLTGAGQRTYVFGYNETLAKGETTSKLFEKVQLKNIIENEIAADQIQNIKVEAFAIQADNIMGASGAVDTSSLNKTKLEEIYEIYVEQNGNIDENGDMIYSNYQDSEHGTVEKEANVNNIYDLGGTQNENIIGTEIKASVNNPILFLNRKSGEAESASLTVTYLKNDSAHDAITSIVSTDTDVAAVSVTNLASGAATITPVGIGDATIVVTTNSGAKSAVHISVQRDSRAVTGHDSGNDSSNLPEGSSEH